jgi:multicomponent K+:H+ antiporter subunit D
MSAWIDAAMPHLVVAPIALPLFTAAVLLLVNESRRRAKALTNIVATVAVLAIAIALMQWVVLHATASAVGVYLPSNWQAPFGIVLAVDRLSAMMLVLNGVIGLASLLFATARWHRAGVHYHSLFQLQLMGINGAFLTADLFNLFVFFEVMLAASYGLLLHGSGRARVSAGLKYIAVNLLASSLFLIGVAIVYGITGTLNYADIAQKIALVPATDRGLLHAGAALLGIAFLAKAAMWPLNFWLTPAYSAASASAAALFVVLTKVGVYTVLRLWTLLLAAEAGAAVWFGADALVYGGLVTLAFGAAGVVASHRLRRTAGFAMIVSSGTLLAAIGLGHATLIGGALYYLLGSTLAVSALYLLIELIERNGEFETAPPVYDDAADHAPLYLAAGEHVAPAAAESGDAPLIGKPIPAAIAFLGLSFMTCALLIAGLPPLSGFLAKFAMLSALLDPAGIDASAANSPVPAAHWTLLALLIGSGLSSIVGLSRAGARHFWTPQGRAVPHLRVIECVPIAALLGLCALLAVRAGPVLDYTEAAAAAVIDPTRYVQAVMSATPVPPPRDRTLRAAQTAMP